MEFKLSSMRSNQSIHSTCRPKALAFMLCCLVLAKLSDSQRGAMTYWKEMTVKIRQTLMETILTFLLQYGRIRPDGVEYFDFEGEFIRKCELSISLKSSLLVKTGVVKAVLSISRGKLYENPPPSLVLKYGSFPSNENYDQIIHVNKSANSSAMVVENLRVDVICALDPPHSSQIDASLDIIMQHFMEDLCLVPSPLLWGKQHSYHFTSQ